MVGFSSFFVSLSPFLFLNLSYLHQLQLGIYISENALKPPESKNTNKRKRVQNCCQCYAAKKSLQKHSSRRLSEITLTSLILFQNKRASEGDSLDTQINMVWRRNRQGHSLRIQKYWGLTNPYAPPFLHCYLEELNPLPAISSKLNPRIFKAHIDILSKDLFKSEYKCCCTYESIN